MGSVSEGETSDQHSERCGSYCPSADVSESESSSEFSCRRCAEGVGCGKGGASSSMSSSPFPSLAGTSRFPVVEFLPEIVAGSAVWDERLEKKEPNLSVKSLSFGPEVEMMKERFAKLLLGEDMSGGGKGVCTALAISNAITNLSATVFGELWRLEPLAAQKKAMWRREMEWLLCVSDSIVELIPSIQEFPGGGTFEVMVPRSRSDLFMNLPALKKLDAMLLGMLDGFKDTEFWYVDRGILYADGDGNGDSGPYPASSFGRLSIRQEEKWWLPCPRVLPKGLQEETRKRLQQCRDCANQILKAAMAINSTVLADMAIPEAYLETLPKSGKTCLGDIIYRYITADQFSSECLLDCLDLSSEHHTLEIANRVEAAIHVWRQKNRKSHTSHGKAKKSTWSGKVKSIVSDAEKNHFLANRADGLLLSLKLRYPGLPQTVLDMNKIQYNKDVGQAILESYSRVMESLAFNIIARIDDLIYVDDMTKKCPVSEVTSLFNPGGIGGLPVQKKISPSPFSIHNSPYASPFATPTFNSSTPVHGSPRRAHPSLLKEKNLMKSVPGNCERVRSYTGNLSARKDSGDAPERD